MRKMILVCLAATAAIGAAACSGSYGSAPSAASSISPADSSGVVTVNVVAINGAQSFSPNPATLPSGQKIMWHNIDTVTHRVVWNDGAVDTGNLAPGAFSQPMTIGSGTGAYHCSIHPEMIGSINQVASASIPAPSTQY